MELDRISAAPDPADFISLDEYQRETPATFIGGKPVLHLRSPNARIVLQNPSSVGIFGALVDSQANTQPRDASTTNGHVNGDAQTTPSSHQAPSVIDGVDVTVASDHLYLFSPFLETGFKLSYPSIGLHALASIPDPSMQTTSIVPSPSSSTVEAPAPQQQPNPTGNQVKAVYMQLNLYDVANSNSDDDVLTADVAIVPAGTAGHSGADGPLSPVAVEAQALFDAVSACQDAHPDPAEQEHGDGGDEGEGGMGGLLGGGLGGFGGGMPGDGGWITSENVGRFTDGDGNFVGFGVNGGGEEGYDEGEGGHGNGDGEGVVRILGPGAGSVRQRDEVDGGPDRTQGAEGDGERVAGEDDAKRLRVE